MIVRSVTMLIIAVLISGGRESLAAQPQRQNLGELHILAHRPIDNLAELNGRRIVITTGGKITKDVMVRLVRVLNIKPEKIYITEPARAMISVLNDDVDAVLFVGRKPALYFKNMERLAAIKTGPNAGKLDQVHLLSIDSTALPDGLLPAVLTHSDYSYIDENVHTLEVTTSFAAVLAAH